MTKDKNLNGLELSPEAMNKQILAQRAAVLAKELSPEVQDNTITILHFQLAYEQYAIETKFLREALFIKEIAILPLTPKFVVGVVNVHGEIVSALDIRKFFNLPGEPINDLNRLLVLNDRDMTFGILVDRIRGIRTVNQSTIMKANMSLTGIKSEYIIGVTEENIVILNGAAILNDPDIIIRQV
jgi:purine-binding chemotaxis protein CheW